MGSRGVRVLGLAVCLMASCVVSPTPREAAAKAGWERATGGTPHQVIRAFYGKWEVVELLLKESGDPARAVRRWARTGNGAISVRFVDEKGRGLKVVECGGQLIVEGQPGQAYAVRVRNETDVPVEILPLVDGLDLETGEDGDLGRPGRRLGPREETVFGARAGTEKGKAEVLRFRDTTGPEPLFRTSPTGTEGSVVLAVFLGKGADSFDDRPMLKRRRTVGVAPAGGMQMGRFEPMLLPYQYQ